MIGMKPVRAELRVTLRHNTLLIPYPAVLHDESGQPNVGYRCLLDVPEAIDELPEFYFEPALKEFVAEIHGPGKRCETVRSVTGHEVMDGGMHRSLLMLGFMFRDRVHFRDLDFCFLFASELMQREYEVPGSFHGEPLLEIQPARLLLEDDRRGWGMDLHLGGVGPTAGAAREDLVRQWRNVPLLL